MLQKLLDVYTEAILDDTVVLFLLGGSGFERICLQVGTVNRWLPERCFGFVFFLALIGKLSTNRTVLLQKKKQTNRRNTKSPPTPSLSVISVRRARSAASDHP